MSMKYRTMTVLPLAAVAVIFAAVPPSAEAAKILFVGSGSTPSAGADGAVMTHLTSRYGTAATLGDEGVFYKQDTASATADAALVDAVIISSTPNSGNVRNKFQDVTQGVMDWEAALYGTTTGNFQMSTGFGQAAGTETQITIEDPAHPLAAGLSGTVTVTSVAEWMMYGKDDLGTGVDLVASTMAGQHAIFAADVGDALLGNGSPGSPAVAPGRRVMFFLHDNAFANLTPDGLKLFDAATDWTLGNPEPATAFRLTITPGGADYDFTWTSKDNYFYDLVSHTALFPTPDTWPVWDGRADIADTAPSNTLLKIPGGGDSKRFFAVVEKDSPSSPLQNRSFEDPEIADGEFTTVAPPDWSEFDAGGLGDVGVWNPLASEHSTVPDGENVGRVYHAGSVPMTAFGVSQMLGANFAENTDYQVTVAVGRSASFAWPGYRVELWAGATRIAEESNPAVPAPDNWATSTVDYTYSAADAGLAGEPLELRLLSLGEDPEGTGSGAGFSVEFDQVTFTATPAVPAVSGELKQWHKVTLTFNGPSTSETAGTNPFLDYRLNLTFTQGGTSIVVPGYYCADGDAANTGATSGNKWRAHFSPSTTGTWNYAASFRTGANVAVSSSATAGSATSFDGTSGSIDVGATDKTGDDLRGKGLVTLAPGKHHFRHAGTGDYWIKGGTDSPEDFLGCSDFDNTVTGNATFPATTYPAHVGDWNAGDPTWGSGKGKGIIGVLNYLGAQRVNSVYFLPMNLGGDGQNTHPFAGTSNDLVYDCSKLDQWGVVFDHAQEKGILMHVVLNEAEAANRNRLDNGTLGTERKLFYRELAARFGHVNGLMWNVCEEGIASFDPPGIMKPFADYVRSVDPYDHPIGVHNWIKEDGIDVVFADFYNHPSIDYLSIQYRSSYIREDYPDPRITHMLADLRAGTAGAGKPLALTSDEFERVLPSDDESHSLGLFSTGGMKWHRKAHLWQWYLGGGAGVEYIVDGLLNTHDFRQYEPLWRYTRHARNFMDQIPFGDMVPSHDLLSGESTYANTNPLISGVVLAKPGEIYAIQLPDSTSTGTLDLSGAAGSFTRRWYNPRTGSFDGATTTITGGGNVALGAPPSSPGEDWVVLIEKSGA